jgi:hypothetical protein
MSFERFNLDPKIMSGVRALGYTSPTPIQLDSIPPIMAGSDLMGLAQPGREKLPPSCCRSCSASCRGPAGVSGH